jgi:hypothetical protein
MHETLKGVYDSSSLIHTWKKQAILCVHEHDDG